MAQAGAGGGHQTASRSGAGTHNGVSIRALINPRKRMAVLAMAAMLTATPASAAPERRCGWLHNPTPANWWLEDRDGQWILGTQGSEQVPGMDVMRDMASRGWVKTNGYYGYGCACLGLETDRRAKRVLRLLSATPLPLRQCRADKRLPPP
jgi:hypothetical protein